MFDLDPPIWESLTRATLIYVFLLIAIRLTGKRQVGELTPFDIVIQIGRAHV